MKNYIPTKDKKIGLETNDQIITEEEKGTYGYEFQLYTIDPIAVSDMKIVQGNCNIINWRGYYMIVKIKNIFYIGWLSRIITPPSGGYCEIYWTADGIIWPYFNQAYDAFQLGEEYRGVCTADY